MKLGTLNINIQFVPQRKDKTQRATIKKRQSAKAVQVNNSCLL